MKKLLMVVAALLLMAGLFVTWFLSGLDGRVHDAIERAGSEALGVAVSVGSVDLDLAAGTGRINGFEIANPPGFSRHPAFSAEELELVLSDGGVDLVRLQGPTLRVEGSLEKNNIGALVDGMPQAPAQEPSSEAVESEEVDEEGEPVRLVIRRVEIAGIRAVVESAEAEAPTDLDLGEISFTDLEGTTEEIAAQAARQLASQLAEAARKVLREAVGSVLEQKVDEFKEGLREKFGGNREASDDEAEDGGGDGN